MKGGALSAMICPRNDRVRSTHFCRSPTAIPSNIQNARRAPLDHRLALLFLAALHLGTAVPLAFGWCVFFRRKRLLFKSIALPRVVGPSTPTATKRKKAPVAIPWRWFFLFVSPLVMLSSFQGYREVRVRSIPTVIRRTHPNGPVCSDLVPGRGSRFSAAYSLLRPNFLRVR